MIENVYEEVENIPGPSHLPLPFAARTMPIAGLVNARPVNERDETAAVRNHLPAQPDFLGFDEDSSSDDGYNTEFWRVQLQSDLPETDDDSTYSPSHVQIFIPEGAIQQPNFFRRFSSFLKSTLFLF